MGSSEKYWRWARDCEEWARSAQKPEERDMLKEMARAWANVAKTDDDVSEQAERELKQPHR